MTDQRLGKRQLRPIIRAIERREEELQRMFAEERERTYTEGFTELLEPSVDVADHAFARIQLGIEYKRIEGYLVEMRALVAARERLENGTFGVCVDCGETIDEARLAASPSAARCALCQQRREHEDMLRH